MKEVIEMRYIVALVVTTAFFAQTRTASAQQPAQQQQVLVPYAVCAGTSQSELCDVLAWVREQQAAGTAVAPLGAPQPVPVVAVRPPPQCRSGHAGDECRCRARGGILQQGRCVSMRTVVAAVSTDTRDLVTRMTAAEAAIAQLRSGQANTNRRVSQNEAVTSCLEVILLPSVGADPAATRQQVTEERAAALGRTHGPQCADLYRVAYGLTPTTAPAPTPAPPSVPAPSAAAHAPSPAAETPITVVFQ